MINPHSDGRAIARKCTCDSCDKVYRAYWRNYRERKRAGISFYTDAIPVREHVQSLQASGMGWRKVAENAGVEPATVSRLLYGHRGSAPSRRVHVMTAKRLLSVTAEWSNFRPQAPVDGTVTVRKLQALVAIGWSPVKLADKLGVDRSWIPKILSRSTVSVRMRLSVDDLYEELWNTPPTVVSGRDRQAFTRAVRFAERNGFRRPMDWDDIEDLAEQPVVPDPELVDEVKVRRVVSGHGDPRALTRPERRAAVRLLVSRGYSVGGAADLLRMGHDTAKKAVAA